jgi:hypothetical protein
MNQRSLFSRRVFLKAGTVATAGGFLTLMPQGAFAQTNVDPLLTQLKALYTHPDTPALFKLLSTIASDPAYPAMATDILTNYGTSLTNFQTSLLQAFQTMTGDPGMISTVLSGQILTKQQGLSFKHIRSTLRDNPAIHMILEHANKLREPHNKQILQSYVAAGLPLTVNFAGPNTTLGDPTLDAVVTDAYLLASSPAFQGLQTPVTSLLQRSDFISFLQKQPPEVIATYIPANILLSFLLPGDQDPPLPQNIWDQLYLIVPLSGVLNALLATITFFSLSSAFLTPAGVVLAIAGTIELDIALLILSGLWMGYKWAVAVNDIYMAMDCDHDGDPSDPSDVAGSEC